MCVIIDTNCISTLFDPNSAAHVRLKPILQWITRGSGRMVYGGSKYIQELGRMRSYVPIIAELRRQGRAVVVSGPDVDAHEVRIKKLKCNSKFNDQHLIAIVIVSGCRVICTTEEDAIPYIHDRRYYPAGTKLPSIYRNSSHRKLCAPKNIVKCCRQ